MYEFVSRRTSSAIAAEHVLIGTQIICFLLHCWYVLQLTREAEDKDKGKDTCMVDPKIVQFV
jgi:hypothetical protein